MVGTVADDLVIARGYLIVVRAVGSGERGAAAIRLRLSFAGMQFLFSARRTRLTHPELADVICYGRRPQLWNRKHRASRGHTRSLREQHSGGAIFMAGCLPLLVVFGLIG